MSAVDAERFVKLARARALLETRVFNARGDAAAWKRAMRAQLKHEKKIGSAVSDELEKLRESIGADAAVKVGVAAWKKVAKRRFPFIRKAADEPRPDIGWAASRLSAKGGGGAWKDGATGTLVGLLLDAGEDSGQYTLDALGIDETFAWANPRTFPEPVWHVRGSKVVAGLYENHMLALAKMVVDKTNPTSPATIDEMTAAVKAEWPEIARWQASRIARTEASNAWQTTAWNAMNLNGVTSVSPIIAQGPSVGVESEDPCEECVAYAADGPYSMDEMDEIPPIHPNCRCTLVPQLEDDWLPPAQPWTGAEVELEMFA